MEFEISNESLATLRAVTITANFPELYAWLDTELEPYLNMAVTEETLPVAKTYRAKLRTMKERIEAYRKEAKQAALSSYNKFEADCKVATGKIDTAVENIDTQVKEAEQREADEKIARIKEVYDEFADTEAASFFPWSRMLNPKWSNKTYSEDTAKGEVRDFMLTTEQDIATIRGMGGDDIPALLDCYRQTLDMSAVVRKASELKTTREREEQRKREAEERRKAEEEAKVKRKAEEKKAAADFFAEEEPRDNPDPLITIAFEVVCKQSQLAGLGDYMKRNGIVYRRA